MNKTFLLISSLLFTNAIFAAGTSLPTITNIGDYPIEVVQTVGSPDYSLSAIELVTSNNNTTIKSSTATVCVRAFLNGIYFREEIYKNQDNNVCFNPETETFTIDYIGY